MLALPPRRISLAYPTNPRTDNGGQAARPDGHTAQGMAATAKTRTAPRSSLMSGRICTLDTVDITRVLLPWEPSHVSTSLPHRAGAQGNRSGIAPHRTKRQRLSHPTSFARPPPRGGGLRHATDCPSAYCLTGYRPKRRRSLRIRVCSGCRRLGKSDSRWAQRLPIRAFLSVPRSRRCRSPWRP